MIFYGGLLIVSSAVRASVLGWSPCSTTIPDLCPPLWEQCNGTCYRLTETEDGETWDDTRAACRAMGGQLAAPSSPEESHFLALLAKKADLVYLWIACNDIVTEGKWVCEGQGNGEGFFYWSDTSPVNGNGLEDCAYLTAQPTTYLGLWYNYPCYIHYHGACVILTVSSPPSPSRSRDKLFAITTNIDPFNSCLVGHVINEFVITNIPSCAFACIKEPRCRSINIRVTEQGGEKVCQLNDSTRFDDQNNFQNSSIGCVHYSLNS